VTITLCNRLNLASQRSLFFSRTDFLLTVPTCLDLGRLRTADAVTE